MKTVIVKNNIVQNVIDGQSDLPLSESESKIECSDDTYIGGGFKKDENGDWLPPEEDYGWLEK